MEKRLIIAIALSAVVLFGWNFIFPPAERLQPVPGPADTSISETFESRPEREQERGTGSTDAAATDDAESPDPLEEPELAVAAALEETVELDTDLFLVSLTNRGGRIARWSLRDYTTGDGMPLELWPQLESTDLPLAIDLDDPDLTDRLNDALYEVERYSDRDGETIVFTWSDGRGLTARKALTFRSDDYLVDIALEVMDRGRRLPARLTVGPGFAAQEKRKGQSNYYYSSQALWDIGGNVDRTKARKLDPVGGFTADVAWAGLEDQYFTALIIPSATRSQVSWRVQSLTEVATAEQQAIGELPDAEDLPILAVSIPEAGGQLFIGPKKYTMLRGLDHELERSVWFSSQAWLGVIVKYIYLALLWLHDNVAYNYGLAIILATLALRILLFPVNQYAMVSMKKSQLQMQRLQPKMKSIRARYKKQKDAASRAKMNQEMMDLYKREGVNPMGGVTGCLPLLAQFPILIGFYNMLTVAVELRGAPFIFWIQDLSVKDPYWITPLLMGVTMFAQQKLAMSKVKDPQQLQQQKIMMFMPVMFTFICLQMPSGLVLYWFMNNLLGIGQQYLVNKHTSKLDQPGPQPAAKARGDQDGERVRGKKSKRGQAGSS